MKRKFGLALDIQWFARPILMNADGGGDGGAGGDGGQGGGDGGNSGSGTGGQGGNAGGQGGQGGNNNGEGNKTPFAVFPDEASFMSRVKREAKTQVGEFLKGLGFEKEDDLKAIVTAHNTNIENNKTELQKANDAKAAAEALAANTSALLSKTMINSEAKVQALSLGIKPERIDYAMKLADLSGITVTDGAVNGDAIKEALQKVLTELPELKGTVVPGAGGGDFGSGNGGGDLLTWKAIESMSTAEAEKRMPEIMEFMTKNPR